MKSFEKVSFIKNCTLQELFDFHLDVSNIKKITPEDTKVTVLNKNFKPHESGILNIRTVKNFIPTTWKVQIVKLQAPNILEDLALESPFKYWKHTHEFTQKGNICQMRDIVEYELPFGKFGEMFDFFIQNELKTMFDYRHEKTQEILSNKI